MTDPSLIAEIEAYPCWYHRFEVLPGVWTKGEYELQKPADYLRDWFGISSLSGREMLDIATFDGGFAFGFEDLGARVLAVDVIDQSRTGFATAARVRKSAVRFEQLSVYDLDESRHGPFDLVHFSGLHYHLKHPILAVEKINAVLRKGGIVFGNGASGEFLYRDFVTSEPDPETRGLLRNLPLAYYLDGRYNQDPTNWILFNDAGWRNVLARGGFTVETCESHAASDGTSRGTCYFKATKVGDPDPEYWPDNHKQMSKS